METKGWDVFRNLPPDTDSGSETNQQCLGHVVRVLKVGERRRGRRNRGETKIAKYHTCTGCPLWCDQPISVQH